jgi:hypothetical protein
MTNYHTTVLDHRGLLRLFRQVAGRRLIGPVDGVGCVELVFEDPDDQGGNLVSIFTDGRDRGTVTLGFVDRLLIEDGYGAPEEQQEAS